jgi:hypothetical protein
VQLVFRPEVELQCVHECDDWQRISFALHGAIPSW